HPEAIALAGWSRLLGRVVAEQVPAVAREVTSTQVPGRGGLRRGVFAGVRADAAFERGSTRGSNGGMADVLVLGDQGNREQERQKRGREHEGLHERLSTLVPQRLCVHGGLNESRPLRRRAMAPAQAQAALASTDCTNWRTRCDPATAGDGGNTPPLPRPRPSVRRRGR